MLKFLGLLTVVAAVVCFLLWWSSEAPTSIDAPTSTPRFEVSPSEPPAAEPIARIEVPEPAAQSPPAPAPWPPEILPLIDRPDEPSGLVVGYLFDVRGAPVGDHSIGFCQDRRQSDWAKTKPDGTYSIKLAIGVWKVTYRRPNVGGSTNGLHVGSVEVFADRTTTFNVQLRGDATLTGNTYIEDRLDNIVQVRLIDARSGLEVGMCEVTGRDPLERNAPEKRPPLADRPAQKKPGYFAFGGLPHGHYLLTIKPGWMLPPEIQPYFKAQERPIEIDGDLELPVMVFTQDDFGLKHRKAASGEAKADK